MPTTAIGRPKMATSLFADIIRAPKIVTHIPQINRRLKLLISKLACVML
jgi:hypothetical protein